MNNLFEELKRRNVVRVGIAYAVVGWILAQVAELVLPTFGATAKVFPESTQLIDFKQFTG